LVSKIILEKFKS